jgi:hypothetical protein
LLKELYGEILIPQAVYEETVINGIRYGFEDAYTLRLFLKQNNWKTQKLLHIPQEIASANLDKGEKDAIALALAKSALLLMDEELGRAIAREQGLKVKGSLGILIEAYRKKMINFEQLRFYFIQIGNRNDIWISSKLCEKLLKSIEKSHI